MFPTKPRRMRRPRNKTVGHKSANVEALRTSRDTSASGFMDVISEVIEITEVSSALRVLVLISKVTGVALVVFGPQVWNFIPSMLSCTFGLLYCSNVAI